MKPYISILKSLGLICFSVPMMAFGTEQEAVDTDVSESNEGLIQEAHCGWGGGYVFDATRANYLPGSVHIISQISVLGDEIRLEDGSAWKVSPGDCQQALQWQDVRTPVSIVQNSGLFSWFSSYSFRIVNRNTGNSIVANLFQGPFKGGVKSHYVVEYDYDRGTVKLSSLEEVTRFEVHPSDLPRFREWNFYESIPVIIGQNADNDAYWDSLLINVRKTKNFIRVHQY